MTTHELDQLRAQIAELLAIIGASTPIAAFDLATTWRAEKALMQDEIEELKAERDEVRAALILAIEQIGGDMYYVPIDIERRLYAAAGLPLRGIVAQIDAARDAREGASGA